MDLEEIIKYCGGLPFLRKGRVEYHEEVSVAWMGRHLSFEKFFEELSEEGKENILFHLDLFRER